MAISFAVRFFTNAQMLSHVSWALKYAIKASVRAFPRCPTIAGNITIES